MRFRAFCTLCALCALYVHIVRQPPLCACCAFMNGITSFDVADNFYYESRALRSAVPLNLPPILQCLRFTSGAYYSDSHGVTYFRLLNLCALDATLPPSLRKSEEKLKIHLKHELRKSENFRAYVHNTMKNYIFETDLCAYDTYIERF